MKRFLPLFIFATLLTAAPAVFVSDWFFGNLISPLWSQANLRGGSASQSGGFLTLVAPSGSNHDNITGWVQVNQTTTNGDFAVIAKMTTKPTEPGDAVSFYATGIAALQDSSNGLYFEYAANGFAGVYQFTLVKAVAGTQTTLGQVNRSSSGDAPPYYLELIKSGSTWTANYSFDGSTWTTLTTAAQAFTISSLAAFSNNFDSTSTSALANTATFDYICNAINNTCIARQIPRMFNFPFMGSAYNGGGGGSVTLTPGGISFDSQTVGTSSVPQNATLSNTTGTPASISSVSVTGVNASSFTQATSCGSSLAAHTSCNIPVTFTPTTTGSLTASLQVTSTPPVTTVALSGTGVATPTACNPPRVTVTGNNNSGDYTLLQTALNGAGNIALNGTFAIGTNQLTFNSNTCVTSSTSARVNYTGTDYAGFLAASGTNITINGITISGGGLYMHRTGNNNVATNISLTNDLIENVTSGKNGFVTEAVMRNMTISGTTFQNIGQGGWGPPPNGGNPGNPCPGAGCGDYNGGAIRALSGFDGVQITHNHFNEILNDGIAADMDLCIDNDSTISSCSNNIIGYNDFQNIYRMGIEWQTSTGGCPNGCNFGLISSVVLNNSVVGNAYHNNARGYYQTYWNSNIPGKNTNYLNNTCLMDNTGFGSTAADCYEVSNEPGTVLVQGNVTGTATTMSKSFQHAYIVATPSTGTTQLLQNNLHCGPIMAFQTTETSGTGGTLTIQHNFNNYPSGCPWNATNPFVSGISPAWNPGNPTSFPSGGSGTWHMNVISNLSVISVDFRVDSTSGTPAVTQTISDLSSTFETDREWLYHATINTSTYGNGNHTLYATVTDVTGATQTISAPFTVGP